VGGNTAAITGHFSATDQAGAGTVDRST